MWVDDDALLEELAAALSPPDSLALEPTVAEQEALRAAVAGRFPRLDWQPPQPRSRMWRALPLAAAGILVPGTAAAAAGVPLPRPVRAVAHAVGLPVDSPALYDTYRHARELRQAVEDRDPVRVRETAVKLQKDLKVVPADDRKEAHEAGLPALAEAAPLLQETPPPAPAPAPPGPAPAETTTPTGDPASEPPTTQPRPRPASTTETTGETTTSTSSSDTTTSTTEAPAASDEQPSDETSSTTTSTTEGSDSDPTTSSSSSSSTTTTTTVEETQPRS